MRVLDVRHKGVYITLEFSSEKLQQILDFLDHSKCTFNSEAEPDMIAVNEYVVNEFYPDLNALLKEVANGP